MLTIRRLPAAAARPLRTLSPPSVTAIALRPLSTSRVLRSGHDSHESQYDPPTGWLFGVKPGEEYEEQGWETLMKYGFCGCMGLLVVGYIFKPDTSIQTWALEEARRRLEAEGILEDPEAKSG